MEHSVVATIKCAQYVYDIVAFYVKGNYCYLVKQTDCGDTDYLGVYLTYAEALESIAQHMREHDADNRMQMWTDFCMACSSIDIPKPEHDMY